MKSPDSLPVQLSKYSQNKTRSLAFGEHLLGVRHVWTNADNTPLYR